MWGEAYFLQEHRGEVALFDDLFCSMSEQTRLYIRKFWDEMVRAGRRHSSADNQRVGSESPQDV